MMIFISREALFLFGTGYQKVHKPTNRQTELYFMVEYRSAPPQDDK